MAESPVAPEPIRILSDLHLGHPACRIGAVEQLEPLLDGCRTLVLNGDTAELRYRKFRGAGEAHLSVLQTACDDRGIDLYLLTGNHDSEISDRHHLELLDGRLFLTHGDALFDYVSPWNRKLSQLKPLIDEIRAEYSEARLSHLEGRLEYLQEARRVTPGFDNEFRTGWLKTVRTALRFAWPPHRPVNILRAWATAHHEAHNFADRYCSGASFFLFGHTHFPGCWARDHRVAINTGGFMSIGQAWMVEIAGGQLDVRKVDESGGTFGPGAMVRRFSISGFM